MDTICYDHKMNAYASQKDMCNHYGISPETFRFRLKKGMSIEQALTTPLSKKTNISDHLGNIFPTQKAMCDHWNIPREVFKGRKSLNWSMEKILTTPVDKKTYKDLPTTDHIGNTFPTFKSMCDYWSINPSTVKSRLDANYSLEDALSSKHLVKQTITDHLGNTFDSQTDLCNYWGISPDKYRRGLKNNQSLKEILTINHNQYEYDDTIGHIFKTSEELCQFYNISIHAFHHRQNANKSMIETIGIIPILNRYTHDIEIYPNYIIQNHITNDYYECIIDGQNVIQHYTAIISAATEYFKSNK